MFLPLLVTQALQKRYRGGVGQAGRSVKAGREKSGLGASPTPCISPFFTGTLTSSKDASQPSTSTLPTGILGAGGGGVRAGRPLDPPVRPSLFRRGTEAQGDRGHLSGTPDLSSELKSATFWLCPHLWAPDFFMYRMGIKRPLAE